MVSVSVPRSNTRVWEPTGRVKLTQEAEQWLETTVGSQQFRHPDQPEYYPVRSHWVIINSYHSLSSANGTRIFFSDKDHAVLFKLTFL
jgi:hypothetical protein